LIEFSIGYSPFGEHGLFEQPAHFHPASLGAVDRILKREATAQNSTKIGRTVELGLVKKHGSAKISKFKIKQKSVKFSPFILPRDVRR